MNITYSIQPAIINDLNDIKAIENQQFLDAWSYSSFLNAYNSNTISIFVAKDSTQNVLGFVIFSLICDESEILDIAVNKQYESNGIATELLRFTIEHLIKNNCNTIYLDVRKSNAKAIHLYSKIGFVDNGVRKNYYRNPNEDAKEMIMNIGEK